MHTSTNGKCLDYQVLYFFKSAIHMRLIPLLHIYIAKIIIEKVSSSPLLLKQVDAVPLKS